MSRVYDSWERLVEAVLRREELRQLAFCESFGSSITADSSSRLDLDSVLDEMPIEDVPDGVDEEWRNNFSEREACTIKKSKTEKSTRRASDHVRRSKIDLDASQITDVHNYRIFVATWNVAGKSPPSDLNLEEWLHTNRFCSL